MTTNSSSEAPWLTSDVQFAVEEFLCDPHINPHRRAEVFSEIVELCAVSPRVLPRLWRNQHRKPRGIAEWKRAAEKTRALASEHPDRESFEVWRKNRAEFGEAEPEPDNRVLLSRTQSCAWSVLKETADLYFSGKLHELRIQPRTSVLIAGPSGVGKSHLVHAFARERGLACLRLTYGDWIPQGAARSSPPTQDRVRDFLAKHERSLIFIDELDKMHAELRSEWSTSVMNDVFALLDRALFAERSDLPASSVLASNRLRKSTFLVGCGTWQQLWDVSGAAPPLIGFAGPVGIQQMPDRIRASRTIAPELLNRFSPELILLKPMERADFDAIIEADDLRGLAARADVKIDLDAAVASGLGMRWLEALVLRIHLALAAVPSVERKG